MMRRLNRPRVFAQSSVAGALIIVGALTVTASAQLDGPPSLHWMSKPPPLPAPKGEVIRAATVEELFRAAETVRAGGTILLADGLYKMPRYFELRTDGVTLRGASGDRNRVVLDGAESRHGELIGVTRCAGVTIADVTIRNVRFNGIKLNSDTNVQRVTIQNCVIHNVWQRGVKGAAVPAADRAARRPADCRIQNCLFYNDRPKQYSDDPADTPENFGGNYVGGIDVMFAKGWIIRDNVFWGIRGRTGEARGAVFLWHESEDCVVERNIVVDCDSGICLGNSYRPEGVAVHAIRCVVRNNFVVRAPENGILADYTRDCAIVHNTIHDPASRLGRLIRLVHDNDGLLVANNLIDGPEIRVETASEVRLVDNAAGDVADRLADPRRGDLHLRHGAAEGLRGAAKRLELAPEDIDRQPRGEACAVGADEPR